jgi:hypothetical protein
VLIDEDECCIGTFCHEQSTCANSVANFTCTCDSGYTGNGTFCEGIFVNFIASANFSDPKIAFISQ